MEEKRVYTNKIPSLKSTFVDTRELGAKTINTSALKVDGVDINDLAGLKMPEDLPKLITRRSLPEDKNWALTDDEGRTLYINFAEKLKCGKYMFQYYPLSRVPFNFSSLIDGECMFKGSINITSFSSDISKVRNGNSMFMNCTRLKSFESDLSSLTSGRYMFNSCDSLTSFESNLSSLNNGSCMFQGCDNLKSFESDLSSLTNGLFMFSSCSLDLKSFQRIADTINDVSQLQPGDNIYKTIHIDLEDATLKNSVEGQQAISKLKSKGWEVYINDSKV